MANRLLEVKELGVSYGDVRAVWDVSLEVEEGTIVALVGANGAGKTTLLKTVSGLLRPLHGQVLFEGEDLAHFDTKHRVDKGIVMVPEGRRLFQGLTVLENLRLGAYQPKGAERLRRIARTSLLAVPACSRSGRTARPAC